MSNSLRLSTALAGIVFLSAPALAATAPEIWAEWQELSTAAGQTITTESVTTNGGTLTVTGFEARTEVEGDTSVARVDELRFIEQGDDTVRVEIEGDYLITSITSVEGVETKIDLVLKQEGESLIVSGPADGRTYDYDADALTIAITDLTTNGEEEPIELEVVGTDVQLDYVVSGTETQVASMDGAVGGVTIKANGSDADSGGTFVIDYTYSDLELASSGPIGAFSPETFADDPSQLIKLDPPFAFEVSNGQAAFAFSGSDGSANFTVSGTSGAGLADFSLGADGIVYRASAEALAVQAESSDFPFPLIVSANEMAFNFVSPTTASEEPVPFEARIGLIGMQVNDGIWNLFDPGELLPRTPATAVIDLAGMATLSKDLVTAGMEEEAPGVLNSIELRDLQLSVAGADVAGTGSFEIDNSAPGMFPGMPKAVGSLNLSATGVDGLLETLVRMGALDSEDLMGMRMMMGMLARPGDTPDSLVSEIELREDGGLFANGMQLQ